MPAAGPSSSNRARPKRNKIGSDAMASNSDALQSQPYEKISKPYDKTTKSTNNPCISSTAKSARQTNLNVNLNKNDQA